MNGRYLEMFNQIDARQWAPWDPDQPAPRAQNPDTPEIPPEDPYPPITESGAADPTRGGAYGASETKRMLKWCSRHSQKHLTSY